VLVSSFLVNEKEMTRFRWFAVVSLTAVVLDQLSKAWVRAALLPGEGREVLPGWVQWTHVHNHGAAWGVLSGRRWLLVAIAALVIAAIVSAAREWGQRSAPANIGLALILGGAVGNLIDRVMQGFVTDFVDLQTPIRWLETFPVWNIADAALTVGVCFIAWDFLRSPESRASEAQPREAPPVEMRETL
jgi:signal peptidase II